MSIAYTRLNGMPIGRGLRPFLAWLLDRFAAAGLRRAILGYNREDLYLLPPAEVRNGDELTPETP